MGERVVAAAVSRYTETHYDKLLAKGWDRWEAREQVQPQIARVLTLWEKRAEA